ncbi:MAG: hypothetical protein NTY48_00470 [Candidatus Diapherotrites archaeon]|nr:hypothetical protein [Candidatus Diapherotrites archaeon]
MELADYTGKPCRSRMAYEFMPKKTVKLDLTKTALELASIAQIEITTKILLMIRIETTTISIFQSGKLLVRGEREEEKAKKVAQKILKNLN